MEYLSGYIYVQSGTVGQASYHFDAGECYVNYCAAPSDWLMDSGYPPPAKKTFCNATYDVGSRTFKGMIDWSPDSFYGGVQYWYRMVFSADYTTIESGEILGYDATGATVQTWVYGRDLHYTWYK